MVNYFLLDNGGRPFKVQVLTRQRRVSIFPKNGPASEESDHTIYEKQPVMTWENVQHVMVGHSPRTPRTEAVEGYGSKYRGNSLLLHLEGLTYVHLGANGKQFKALAPIVRFVSEVGNNEVPYPYAVDEAGRVYLLVDLDKVVLLRRVPPDEDPYDWYYEHIITPSKLSEETRAQFMKRFVRKLKTKIVVEQAV